MVSILLTLAILALPLYSASGLACRGCPVIGAHAGMKLAQAAGPSCCACDCESAPVEGAGDLPEGDADSEQSDDPSSHGCDCPLRCVCGAAKMPIVTAAMKSAVTTAGAAVLVMPCHEALLSDPHLKRLKRPPRFTGSC